MAAPTNLLTLFVQDLRDLYSAEKQLKKALPKLAKGAAHRELRAGFESHAAETDDHLARLEKVFAAVGEKPKAKFCGGMAGLIEEGSAVLEDMSKGVVRDAALAAAAQKCEHYEICAYGTLHAWAQMMGMDRVAVMLLQTLEQEKASNAKLTALAEKALNPAAAAAGSSPDTDASRKAEGKSKAGKKKSRKAR